MTPMKSIVLTGKHLLVEDMAGNVRIVASANTDADAEWLAKSLAAYHGVPLEYSDESIIDLVRRGRA